ncbi:MAG: hypothetical protein M3N27_05675 [Thermoproteota archaeon]|nr:hypothetical protein [Thermoproteota archaeon]
MTLINKSWLKSEILRAYLFGDSQEIIAPQLNIGVGTVNSFLSEMKKSDDTIELQHQIAIVSKKNGVSINQIAVNLRFKNLIKRSCLDDKKIEKFLDAMDMWGNKFSMSPSALANQLHSIIEMTLKENIEPHKLEEIIKLKISKIREIEDEIESANKLLEETKTNVEEKQNRLKIKQKDLDQFHQFSVLFEIYDLPEFSTKYGEIVHALIDMKKMGYDPKTIVSKYEEFESLKEANEKLETKVQESEKLLEHYKRMSDKEEARWKDHHDAFEIFSRLIKDGLKEEDIFMVVNVLKNDFPQSKIEQITEDIRTYGNIIAAKVRLKREYEAGSGFPFDRSYQQ